MSELALADKGVKEQKPTALKIHPTDFHLSADGARKCSVARPREGTPFDALLQPSYWAHIADRLRPFDKIEVHPQDRSFYAELLVLQASRLSAKVHVLKKDDLDVIDDATTENEFFIKWKGAQKYSVIRAADKLAVQTGFDTKEAAMTWLANNLRSLTVS